MTDTDPTRKISVNSQSSTSKENKKEVYVWPNANGKSMSWLWCYIKTDWSTECHAYLIVKIFYKKKGTTGRCEHSVSNKINSAVESSPTERQDIVDTKRGERRTGGWNRRSRFLTDAIKVWMSSLVFETLNCKMDDLVKNRDLHRIVWHYRSEVSTG